MTVEVNQAAIETSKPKRDLYQETTDKIMALLEKGVFPWRRTWNQYGLARNYVSGHCYQGINRLIMNNTEHAIPFFMTFKQVQELKGSIKKGAKAEQILYFTIRYKDANNKNITETEAQRLRKEGIEVKVLRFLNYYNVFSVSDVEGIVPIAIGIKFPHIEQPNEPISICEQIVKGMPNPPAFKHKNGNKAYYSPSGDYVNMPKLKQFDNSTAYYITLFHELVHATGHPNRLNRKGVSGAGKFGSATYSEEELIAEMGACFLGAKAGIDCDAVLENSAAYLQGWLKVLQSDKRFIFKVAAQAQEANRYILGSEGEE